MSEVRPRFTRPAWPLLLTEAPRAALEMASLAGAWPWLWSAPRGDGHPVLVLPGLFATDAYTTILRTWLGSRGWVASGWEAGRNWGHWEALESRVVPMIERLHATHGRRVSLVGASMGGLYARAAARRVPQLVRSVVTLSSAVEPAGEGTHVAPVYEAVTGQRADTLSVPPAPVPCTSVFSRADGLSDWRPVLLPRGTQMENVEVIASHLGMAWHPAVLFLLADRLAQPEQHWQRFAPPAWAAGWFPREVATTESPTP